MEKNKEIKKIKVIDYVKKHSDRLRNYVNVEELTINGKCKVTTNQGNERMYLSLINQNGRRVVINPEVIDFYYEQTKKGTYKPKMDLKCKALVVDDTFRFNGTSGLEYFVEPGDFIVIYPNKHKFSEFIEGMEMIEFIDKYALAKQKTRNKQSEFQA